MLQHICDSKLFKYYGNECHIDIQHKCYHRASCSVSLSTLLSKDTLLVSLTIPYIHFPGNAKGLHIQISDKLGISPTSPWYFTYLINRYFTYCFPWLSGFHLLPLTLKPLPTYDPLASLHDFHSILTVLKHIYLLCSPLPPSTVETELEIEAGGLICDPPLFNTQVAWTQP